ncbi:MAG: cell division protein FtsQ/DivIB [Gammaproteobacteria bacterium]|nr:cell division protein FtsQ/DivIB [Gammaproteobacteria bacterium]
MAKTSQAIKGNRQQRRTLRNERIAKLLASGLWRKLLVLGLLVGGWQLLQSSLRELDVLPIENVYIEGEFNYLSHEQLKRRAAPYVSGGFFTVNLQQLRSQLITLPWVEDVSIRRQWPDSLQLRVIEKQPVAYWRDDQLLSSRAVLFKPETLDKPISIPTISGPEGQHEDMLRELGRLQAWLADSGLRIKNLEQDERRSWNVTMESGLELRLGRKMMHERVQRFAEAYQKQLLKQAKQIHRVDMRYTNGFAVAWKQDKQGRGV